MGGEGGDGTSLSESGETHHHNLILSFQTTVANPGYVIVSTLSRLLRCINNNIRPIYINIFWCAIKLNYVILRAKKYPDIYEKKISSFIF